MTLTPIGKIILRELIRIESQYPDVLVRRWVIMPDHLHFVLWVTHKFPYGLGRAVGHFKAKATGMLRKEDAKFASLGISLFAKGFHDRILTRRGMLDSLLNYVETNPLRLLMRRRSRDNFQRRVIEIGGLIYSAYGNLGLLSDPWRLTIRWSSKYKNGEWERMLQQGKEIARCGGVLISPFINPHEKEAMKDLMLQGARVIKLTEYSIGERWHAKGEDFSLCSQGRLLLLGKEEGGISPHVISRGEAMELNKEARLISDSLRLRDYRILSRI